MGWGRNRTMVDSHFLPLGTWSEKLETVLYLSPNSGWAISVGLLLENNRPQGNSNLHGEHPVRFSHSKPRLAQKTAAASASARVSIAQPLEEIFFSTSAAIH